LLFSLLVRFYLSFHTFATSVTPHLVYIRGLYASTGSPRVAHSCFTRSHVALRNTSLTCRLWVLSTRLPHTLFLTRVLTPHTAHYSSWLRTVTSPHTVGSFHLVHTLHTRVLHTPLFTRSRFLPWFGSFAWFTVHIPWFLHRSLGLRFRPLIFAVTHTLAHTHAVTFTRFAPSHAHTHYSHMVVFACPFTHGSAGWFTHLLLVFIYTFTCRYGSFVTFSLRTQVLPLLPVTLTSRVRLVATTFARFVSLTFVHGCVWVTFRMDSLLDFTWFKTVCVCTTLTPFGSHLHHGSFGSVWVHAFLLFVLQHTTTFTFTFRSHLAFTTFTVRVRFTFTPAFHLRSWIPFSHAYSRLRFVSFAFVHLVHVSFTTFSLYAWFRSPCVPCVSFVPENDSEDGGRRAARTVYVCILRAVTFYTTRAGYTVPPPAFTFVRYLRSVVPAFRTLPDGGRSPRARCLRSPPHTHAVHILPGSACSSHLRSWFSSGSRSDLRVCTAHAPRAFTGWVRGSFHAVILLPHSFAFHALCARRFTDIHRLVCLGFITFLVYAVRFATLVAALYVTCTPAHVTHWLLHTFTLTHSPFLVARCYCYTRFSLVTVCLPHCFHAVPARLVCLSLCLVPNSFARLNIALKTLRRGLGSSPGLFAYLVHRRSRCAATLPPLTVYGWLRLRTSRFTVYLFAAALFHVLDTLSSLPGLPHYWFSFAVSRCRIAFWLHAHAVRSFSRLISRTHLPAFPALALGTVFTFLSRLISRFAAHVRLRCSHLRYATFAFTRSTFTRLVRPCVVFYTAYTRRSVYVSVTFFSRARSRLYASHVAFLYGLRLPSRSGCTRVRSILHSHTTRAAVSLRCVQVHAHTPRASHIFAALVLLLPLSLTVGYGSHSVIGSRYLFATHKFTFHVYLFCVPVLVVYFFVYCRTGSHIHFRFTFTRYLPFSHTHVWT